MDQGDDQRKLLQSEKLEAVGRLSIGIVHDLNNILSGVAGYTASLKIRLGENRECLNRVEAIETAAQRAGGLLQQLLGFVRDEPPRREPVDLNVVAAEVVDLVRVLTERNIIFECDRAEGLAPVIGDPGRAMQLILNLVLNARDAIVGRGTVKVVMRNVESAAAGRRIMVEVADNGVGMSAETKAKIWDPFFTTKGERGGTGIGLSTVQAVVREMNAEIAVESAPGVGTTVQVLIPAAAAP